MNNDAVTILRKAKKLISNPKRWCKNGGNASDSNGRLTDALNTHAVAWCVYGAVLKVDRNVLAGDSVEKLLRKACEKVTKEHSLVSLYNDTHTHEEVMHLLDVAIQLGEEQ